MKRNNLIWLAASVCLLVCCASVFAQVTNTPPATTPPSNPFSIGKDAAWFAVIPLVTFGLTWLIGKIKSLPKQLIPLIVPILGVIVGSLIDWATKANFPWWSQAGAGALATWLYEALKGASNAGPESALTPTPQTPSTRT